MDPQNLVHRFESFSFPSHSMGKKEVSHRHFLPQNIYFVEETPGIMLGLSTWSELLQVQRLFNLHIFRMCTVFLFWRFTHTQEPIMAANRKEQIYINIRGVSYGRVILPDLYNIYIQEILRKLDVLSGFTIGDHNLNNKRSAADSRHWKNFRKTCISLWRKARRQTDFMDAIKMLRIANRR